MILRHLGVLILAVCVTQAAWADGLDAGAQQRIRAATFEVVLDKPQNDPLSYEKALPLDLLPFAERSSKVIPVGTAFSVDGTHFITAAHVLTVGAGSLYGPMALRDAANHLYLLDTVTRFSEAEDYAEFTVRGGPPVRPLEIATALNLNDIVYAVGNALGEGVIIRDGVYTSQTPEERAGRWQWLRFSAAASPGNSGGPLVDRTGRVVGVILRKSPSENLNTAVAIAQVVQGSRASATLEARFPYRFPPLSETGKVELNESISLPRSISEFNAAYAAAISGAFQRSREAALTEHAADLFPNGPGSEDLLNRLYVAPFPRAVVENAHHIWAVDDPKPSGTQTDGHGYVESASYENCSYFRLRIPDEPQRTAVRGNSKLFGELLLKASGMYRPVGGDNVRVTSFGPATREGTYKDPYGRTWQVRVWSVPFSDASVVSFAMPTPEGYVVLSQQVRSVFEGVTTRQLQSLAGFSYFSLSGTLGQWREYLSQPGIPDALRAVELHFDYGQKFRYASKRLSLTIPATVQTIDADSVLILKMTYVRDPSRVVWDVGGVLLADTERQDHWVDVLRRPHPPSSLPTSFADWWKALVTGAHPFTATAYAYNGATQIQEVVNAEDLRADRSSVAYTLEVNVAGTADAQDMKQRLNAVAGGISVLER